MTRKAGGQGNGTSSSPEPAPGRGQQWTCAPKTVYFSPSTWQQKHHLCLSLCCSILKSHFFQLGCAAGDVSCLDAFFWAHPGESFHTVEKLLLTFFRQEHQELRGASDFPCERPTTGLIWRSFIDYGALELSENRFAR